MVLHDFATKTYSIDVLIFLVLVEQHLSFYPGAKIGVVGLNGSGKVRLVDFHVFVFTFEVVIWLLKLEVARCLS